MEQNQLEDGRVRVPEVLRPYMGEKEILESLK
jgi:seryl-tRNA synthetase